eukprot:UN16286
MIQPATQEYLIYVGEWLRLSSGSHVKFHGRQIHVKFKQNWRIIYHARPLYT